VAVDIPNASTVLAAVIGSPVRHSLSPVIHNAAFRAMGIDWIYLAFDVDADGVPAAMDAVRTLGIGGLSVTTPAKEAVAAACDELTPTAAALNAVNCVQREGSNLIGHNTDGAGFVDALVHELGCSPDGLDVVVVGAGAAARAVISGLATAGASRVTVVNRTASRAEMAASVAPGLAGIGSPDDIGSGDLVVNATSVGLASTDPGALPFDPALLGDHQVVVDLIYEPRETALLRAARERGLRTANGNGMLLWQAVHQLRLWTGQEPPVDVVRAALSEALDQRSRGSE
jgi:shikimate dehydrogenase